MGASKICGVCRWTGVSGVLRRGMGPETVFMFIEFQESIVVGLWRWVEAGTDKVRNVAFEERSCGAFGTRISGLEGGVDFRKADAMAVETRMIKRSWRVRA